MSIPSGTLVSLPDGRNGMVIPSPQWSPTRVLVKVQHGRKRWFKAEECLPLLFNPKDADVEPQVSEPV
jgi:hypothetical protein